ncbi:MAG: metabolite traffic protein EboE [Phycisphaerales bacterium]|jgi:hypothetical protein|nr:metabolite traffic protein EboE [Phycisphaerales bacterium]MBT7171894.1 metabolite traffic protein EboE [Phycisphaerales bacterium]
MSDGLYLTYCLNAHPGESLVDIQTAIRRFTMPIRKQVSSDTPFPLGLRLSAEAVDEFQNGKLREAFLGALYQNNLHAVTLNAFPIGQFHDTRIKENVYLPDWFNPARMDYTLGAAQALAACESPAEIRCVSTCPLYFKPAIAAVDERAYRLQCAKHMMMVAVALAKLKEATGQHIAIAIEPEPGCFPETTDEVIAFFSALRDTEFLAHLSEGFGCTGEELRAILDAHLGLCFDTAHQSVMGEDLAHSFMLLTDVHDIPVLKMQLSSAIVCPPGQEARNSLREHFADDVYLHQTMTSQGEFYLDLPEALQNSPLEDELRVHYHVPIFLDQVGPLKTTNDEIRTLLTQMCSLDTYPQVLEIETYTWPAVAETQGLDVVDGIAREFQWVRDALGDSAALFN